MKNSSYLYIRALRHADHSVFVVEKEQKTFWDPQFQQELAYSSGQQVKRSLLENLISTLKERRAPVTFYWGAPKLEEAEVTTPGDPRFVDQLIGGWMIAKSKKSGKQQLTIKRRSPLSISAMRPLHPLLCRVYKENLTFDRRDQPDNNKVIVRSAKDNKILSDEEVDRLLSNTARSLNMKFIQGKKRTSGLFINDIAIDLRTLFCVSTNQLEPELAEETIEDLKNDGWKETENVFGQCLLAPEERRDEIIPALAHALINWRITTNQSRTFSPMETLAVAISENANKVTGAIRAKLIDEGEKPIAKPIVDDSVDGTEVYISLAGAGYFTTNVESVDALDKAEEQLVELMSGFDYEHQLETSSS